MPMNDADRRECLQQLHPASYRWSLVCCRGNPHEAAEILQSSYVKVLEYKRAFRGESSFRTWLFAVIRNTARENARKESARRAALERWVNRSADFRRETPRDPSIELQEEKQALQIQLARLSIRQRQVLHLVFYESMTLQESADVLAITVGSARKHYQRGKQRLREALHKTPIS